jgi:23S rRNA (cytidine2498-2'-O)-methyltransferase
MTAGDFLFVVCQRGAESALKNELARRWPAVPSGLFAPGFVTFKLPPDHGLSPDFDLGSVFARTYGFSLGKVIGDHAEAMADSVWQMAGHRAWDHLHVWQRDPAVPGDHDFEPGISTLADEVGRILAARRPATLAPQRVFPGQSGRSTRTIRSGLRDGRARRVVDRRASGAAMPSRWPGGTPKIDMPDDAVSRAYLKITEASAVVAATVAAGDRCVELGSSPGGSCQALLDRGLIVTGIDPAEMAPAVLEHPNFTHIKPRRRFETPRVPARQMVDGRFQRRAEAHAGYGRTHRHPPPSQYPGHAA